jgi:hypothetical protein
MEDAFAVDYPDGTGMCNGCKSRFAYVLLGFAFVLLSLTRFCLRFAFRFAFVDSVLLSMTGFAFVSPFVLLSSTRFCFH